MIKSFGDRRTERLFADEVVREFQGIARRAKRKLEALTPPAGSTICGCRHPTGWRSRGAI
jgi:plasmid maintenance system killer protein